MNTDELRQTMLRFLHGELDEREQNDLALRLRDDPQVQRRFLRMVRSHANLISLLRQSDAEPAEQAHALEAAQRAAAENYGGALAARRAPSSSRISGRSRRGLQRRTRTWAPVAAAASILLAIAIGMFLRPRPERRKHAARPREPVPVAVRPPKQLVAERFQVRPRPSIASEPIRQVRSPQPREQPRRIEPPPLPNVPPPLPDASQLRPRVARLPRKEPKGRLAKAPAPTLPGPHTERPLAHVTRIQGRVFYARGNQGRWFPAIEGLPLHAGDRLDTRKGRARLRLASPDGDPASVYANQRTRLRILMGATGAGEVPLVSLSIGEVYVQDSGGKVHVETSDGLFSPVGTRFDVIRTLGATVLTVEQGNVAVKTKAGKAAAGRSGLPSRSGSEAVALDRMAWVGGALRVKAGYRTRVQVARAPGRVVKFAASRILAWTGPLKPPRVLLVIRPPLNGVDRAVRQRLRRHGYLVTLAMEKALTLPDLTQVDLIAVSSSTQSGKVQSRFRDVKIPLIVWEPWLFDDLGMTGSVVDADYGFLKPGPGNAVVMRRNHPLAAGLSGKVRLLPEAASVGWGVPNDQALRILALADDPGKMLLFAYEKGARMPGLRAPARRVGFFLDANTILAVTPNPLNEPAWRLFDAAVRWCTERSQAGRR